MTEGSSDLVVAVASPFAVIVPGVTAAAIAEVFDCQHRSFVLVTFVSGAVGGVNAAV